MKKKLSALLIVLYLSLATVFAASPFAAKHNSNVSLETQDASPKIQKHISYETQIGYSINITTIKTKSSSSLIPYSQKLTQGNFSIGEKITYNKDKIVDFTSALTINLAITGESTLVIESLGIDRTTDLDSDTFRNSVELFLGAEKAFLINENFIANASLGANFIYFLENENDNSYFAYGPKLFANVNYILTPSMKVNLGVNASYAPFVIGDFTSSENSDQVFVITPSIGLVYSI